jgi:hypothetical protein
VAVGARLHNTQAAFYVLMGRPTAMIDSVPVVCRLITI